MTLDDETRIFFVRSKLRILVLKKLNEKPQIASFLSKELKKHREVISRIFADLKNSKLAKCKNPESPHFRFYIITKQGKDVLAELTEQ